MLQIKMQLQGSVVKCAVVSFISYIIYQFLSVTSFSIYPTCSCSLCSPAVPLVLSSFSNVGVCSRVWVIVHYSLLFQLFICFSCLLLFLFISYIFCFICLLIFCLSHSLLFWVHSFHSLFIHSIHSYWFLSVPILFIYPSVHLFMFSCISSRS